VGCCGGKSSLTRPCLLERTAFARQPNRLEPDPGHAFVAHAQLVRRNPGQIYDSSPAERAPIVDPHDEGLPGFDGCHLHERAKGKAAVRGYQILWRGVVS
jgi:hypothetical protein